MLRPDRASAKAIEDLIGAYQRQDARACEQLMDRLVESEQDAYMLMLTLATQVAAPIRHLGDLLGAQVRMKTQMQTPASLTAMRLATIIANRERQTASDLARATIAHDPEFVIEVLIALLGLVTDTPAVMLLVPQSITHGQNQMEN